MWSVLVVSLVPLACEEPPAAKEDPKPAAAAVSVQPAAPALVAPKVQEKKKEERTVADCPDGTTVDFPNEEFEAEVRRKLEKPEGDISKADLGKLRSLNVAQIPLTALDVCVFPHMTGLKELFLGKGEYSDLTPIAGATQLESLRVSQNQVTDVTALAEMTKLDRLDLGQTQVEDLKPLSKLVNLTELMLDGTRVSDVAPLEKMTKLERLSLNDTRVKDISALGSVKKLKFLYLKGTPAADDMNFSAVVKNGTRVMTE